ncbi:hypothetical protein Vi05172_g8143 [Venturia inaequalis]|nr:hypothetical protein Vi05172_g8143 [Venturia inaequalis]
MGAILAAANWQLVKAFNDTLLRRESKLMMNMIYAKRKRHISFQSFTGQLLCKIFTHHDFNHCYAGHQGY